MDMMGLGGSYHLAQTLRIDDEILTMALIGFRSERSRLEGMIAELQSRLGGRKIAAAAGPAAPKNSGGGMSEEGRKRIAEAQRKRWAALKKGKPSAAAAKAPRQKRILSAEGRKRIADATKKRWAAYRKAAAAGE
jgi:hypothetical protein